jgi:hypothetical protein
MITRLNWNDKKFNFDFPVENFPSILERFRGTPARLEEITGNLSEEILTLKPEGKWSVKEHAGHLFMLEELGERRLTEFLSGAQILAPADITNRATTEADFNSQKITDILTLFRNARESLVKRLEKLDVKQAGFSSLHPRLNQPMRIIDWVYFMSEHDDHHLAGIRLIIKNSPG